MFERETPHGCRLRSIRACRIQIGWPSQRVAVKNILENEENKEEPTLNSLFKNEYKDRVKIINNTYNVGCSGFVERYMRSTKPIKVAHFHPYNRIAWETHRLDRNGLGVKTVSLRLEKILRKYFPKLRFNLTPEGRVAQELKSEKNYHKLIDNKEANTEEL